MYTFQRVFICCNTESVKIPLVAPEKNEVLAPEVPAPVLSPEDKTHYLPFSSLYGKITTTIADCPSLQPKNLKKDKNEK